MNKQSQILNSLHHIIYDDESNQNNENSNNDNQENINMNSSMNTSAINQDNEESTQKTSNSPTVEKIDTPINKKSSIYTNLSKWLKLVFYIIGIVAICFSIKWYNQDLDPDYMYEIYAEKSNPYRFSEVNYVGGDAYNYMISASRSSAIMTKSLIWMVFGCTFLILGKLTPIFPKENPNDDSKQ